MTEKKPQAGEWWEYNGVRIHIVGITTKGLLSCEYKDGTMSVLRQGDHWKHLTDCKSFEWQPETFPQFYRGEGWSAYDAYVRFDSPDAIGVAFKADGTSRECCQFKFAEVPENITRFAWRKITQAEAESRVRKPEPVNLMNCPDCGEFRGHGHDETCNGKPKPNYVRLWTHRTSGTVCTATDERYLKYPDIWTELKHDGTGFYLADG